MFVLQMEAAMSVRLVMYVYAVILSGYMGWRTWDFMSQQIPPEMGDAGFYLPLLYLFATEIGMIVWLEVSRRATTTHQYVISTVFTYLDFVGSSFAGVADMITRQQMIAMTIPETLARFLTYAMPVLLATNVLAVIAFLKFDADEMRERSDRELNWAAYSGAAKWAKAHKGQLVAAKLDALIAGLQDDANDIGTLKITRVKRRPAAASPLPAASTPDVVPAVNGDNGYHGGTGGNGGDPALANPTLLARLKSLFRV